VIIAKTDDCKLDVKIDSLFFDSGSSVRPTSELKPTQTKESTNAFNNGMFYIKIL
jgi:hypothetical protein